jgi:hypothetical protein
MEKVYLSGLTEDNTREIFKTISSMAKANTHGQMVRIIKDST